MGAPASSLLDSLASISEPLGARRWRRLLRLCPCSAHPAQSRFHRRLPPRQRKFPRTPLRRERSAPVHLSHAHRPPRKSFPRRSCHSLDTFSLPHAHRRPSCARPRLPRRPRRFFRSLPRHHGPSHRFLWIPRFASGLPPRTSICRGALGPWCHALHLVGQFTPRLHVFQSFVVPRTFGFRRRSFSLVLARHALLTLALPVAV